MLGVTVDKVFIERGVSASVKPMATRIERAKLLAALEPGDIIITSRLDRAFRSAKDALGVLEDLQKRWISLHMVDLGGDVTGNGISKLVFTILAAVAAAESDKISELVSEIKADERNRNRHLGGSVPFGFSYLFFLFRHGCRTSDACRSLQRSWRNASAEEHGVIARSRLVSLLSSS
jgi:putative DNA-invertase from lambdoid prophage Rac